MKMSDPDFFLSQFLAEQTCFFYPLVGLFRSCNSYLDSSIWGLCIEIDLEKNCTRVPVKSQDST